MSLIRTQYIRVIHCLGVFLAWMAVAFTALAQGMTTTTVQGTVYLANGSPGSGTLQVSWPAFTTASNQIVAAGKTAATIGADGFVTVNLASNLGSSPAGLYYTAVYHLSDGTTSTEYWVVPAAAQASIAQVRSQIMPAAQAVQAVSKAYVDQAIQSVAQGNLTSTGGQLTGPLYLTGDPTQAMQAADKHYVDSSFAGSMPISGGAATGPMTATQLGAAYQVDQFSGADFGAKLQACLATVNGTYGGTCDARNFSGTLQMAASLSISTANTTVLLPCATISTPSQISVVAGTRNVSLRGCALRGSSQGSGNQGGTVFLYSGTSAAIQVGDNTYVADTLGFHIDNVVINTTGSAWPNTQAFAAYRTQELDLESLYLLGNSNQTGMTLDGTGNYTGGTFYDNHISGFQTAINGVGHQITNSAATDWMNASTFVRLHIDCPTANGNPISGTYGVNLQQGDGNTFTGGDVENCGTALHLGMNAQNNTIMGLRNENSLYQVVADSGSSYNSWMTGGTMFTGKLTDNGTRNSFLDSFHRSFNSLNGDWYGSQQDATLTNHFRLGTGSGNERGLLDRYQTDYGYRWTMGLSDAAGGEQFYQLLDELNNVNRISVGQYNNGQASTNNQTVINSAGSGAVVLNGSSNAGTGGVVFGSGGANETTVGTVTNTGNAQFNGTLQVGGTAQSAGTMTVRNNADAEVDYYLWPGVTASQKGSFTYKDYNGNSQWYMVKDASNNWALNSAAGGLDSFKAYQSTNSGDTYVNASNSAGVVRVNYEPGSGSAFNIYGGNSSNLYASFSGNSSIKMPGLSASSGHNCLQVDALGYISNTGVACGTGNGNGTVNSGSAGQIAYYNNNGAAVSGMNAVPIASGGTGATNPSDALAALNGISSTSTAPQTVAGPFSGSLNSQFNVMNYGAKGDCKTNDTAAFTSAQNAAIGMTLTNGVSNNNLPAVLYLPKPPGGCYIVSNWTWQGVSLEGQPSGLGPASPQTYNVTLKSLPGQDILHIPDPSVTHAAVKVFPGASIRNVGFVVDNGTTNVFANRYPGRWFDDGAMTSGSAQFSTTNGEITCGDVNQAIQVNGAGAGGTNLVSTIASVYPCWQSPTTRGWQVVTLAAPAQTTVSSARSYISVLGLPVTTTIGNCGIAEDLQDGLNSDWGGGSLITGNYWKLENVTFTQTGTNWGQNACGIYIQGNPILYGADIRDFAFLGLAFGVVQGTPVANAFQTSDSGDFEKWDHGAFLFGNYPWISYNGLSQRFEDVQLTGDAGFQILQDANTAFDSAAGWMFDLSSFECPSNMSCTAYGHHITGQGHTITSSFTSGSSSMQAYMDTVDSICTGCDVRYTQVDGAGNQVFANGTPNGLTEAGLNNRITWDYNGNPISGIPFNYQIASSFIKGDGGPIGPKRLTVDAFRDGNPTTTYNSSDLLIVPRDLIFAYTQGYSTNVVPDSTSPTGFYMVASTSGMFGQFSQFEPQNTSGFGNIVIGTHIPASGATVYFSAKCPSGTNSFSLKAGANGGTLGYGGGSCTQTYQTYSLHVSFAASDVGKNFQFGNSANTSYLAWLAIVPDKGAFNGYVPQPQDGSIVLNPTNWAWSGGSGVTDSGSPFGTAQNVPSGAWVNNYKGSTNLNGGALFPAVPSRVTYWVGAPALFTTTLNGAATSGSTSITLASATTSAWPSNGNLQVDNEVFGFSGVSVGQTTITVTRGQYGTLPQSHSSGAAVNLIGTGQLGIKCNGALQSVTDVYYAPAYTTFSSEFPAQNCSGYSTQVGYVQTAYGGTGQQFNVAQIRIAPEPSGLNVPGAENRVPVSTSNSAFGNSWAYNASLPLAGAGAGLTTGPASGTTANHVATFSSTTGQIQDGGVGLPLSGTSGSIGGSALTAGQCASGTASVTGATTSMAVVASPAGGTSPGTGFTWHGYVSSSGTVTVQVCALAAGTPAAGTYNVRVIQ